MNRNTIIEFAQGITNGTEIYIKYRKPADVSKRKLKELGDKKNYYKHTQYEFSFDERGYFQQCMEEQAQNLNPVKEESDYTHVRGMHYQKVDKNGELKDYIRFAIRSDRMNATAFYSTDKMGDSELSYEEIEPLLNESAKKDYKSYNRQMDGITSTGKAPKVEIIQMNLDVDRIVTIREIK